MKCNAKLMLKVAAGLAVVLALLYVAVPGTQAMIAASAPFLLLLLCPLSMMIMVLAMNGNDGDRSKACEHGGSSPKGPRISSDA